MAQLIPWSWAHCSLNKKKGVLGIDRKGCMGHFGYAVPVTGSLIGCRISVTPSQAFWVPLTQEVWYAVVGVVGEFHMIDIVAYFSLPFLENVLSLFTI